MFVRHRLWIGLVAAGLVAFAPVSILQHGLDAPAPVGPFINGVFPAETPGQGSGAWLLQDAFPSLNFVSPIHLEEEPGTSRLLIAEYDGRIVAVDKNPAATVKTTYLDLVNQTYSVTESGLLGFALHPRYGLDSNYIYVFYQYRTSGMQRTYTRVSRFTVSGTPATADPASEVVLIHQYDRANNHNGGSIFFGNDDYLYITMGDEGNQNNAYDNGQSLTKRLLGGVLRIDVDRNPLTSHPIARQPQLIDGTDDSYTDFYFIPNDNPFTGSNGARLEEFYALGMRNPFRASIDKPSGHIWVGDVGQNQREEINLLVSGGNYGWSFREGSLTGPDATPATILGTLTNPVYEYPHSQGNCVIGGQVYRGTIHTDLYGKYVFADNGSKRLWAMTYVPNQAPQIEELMTMPFGASYFSVSAFGLDLDGELYIMRFNGSGNPGGKIYKLTRQNAGLPEPPALLSQTQTFQDLTTLTPYDYLIPYEMNVPFWSDAAIKTRWLILPNDGVMDSPAEQITYSEVNNWAFPAGTVAVKHFELALNETNPAIRRRIETRFMIRGNDGIYYGVSYRWRDDQTDAELLAGSRLDTFTVQTATGPTETVWYYPSRSDCKSCHNEPSGGLLGLKTRQLNGDCFYPLTGRTANQLTTLSHIQAFDNPPDTTNLGALLTSTKNPAAPLQDRALSYLDANCGSCHRPGTGILAEFDSRLQTPINARHLIYGTPVSDLGIHDGRLIVPQAAAASILYKRLSAVHADIAMPALAKNLIDSAGVQLIADWINTMPTNFVASAPQISFDDYAVSSYDATQDNGTAAIQANGTTLLVTDNGWKKIYYTCSITPNTVLEFDFRSTQQGEEHSIGFDSDDTNDGNRFQLYGTQATPAIQTYNTYAGGGWQHYTIPVGTHFTGTFSRMIFNADHDGGASNGNSYFRNVVLHEGSPVSLTYQRIDFPDPGILQAIPGTVTLQASATSGLPVSYNVVSGPGNVTGNTLTLTGAPGLITIRAAQPGNASYEPAAEIERLLYVVPTGAATGSGLPATYYQDIAMTQAGAYRVDTTIDYYWSNRAPMPAIDHGTFSVVWEGELEPVITGNITFHTTTDDGVRLWVNNQLVVDAWQDQISSTHSGQTALTAWQRVPIRMEYYQRAAYGRAKLEWSAQGLSRQVIPRMFLYPPTSLNADNIVFEAVPQQTRVNLTWRTSGWRDVTHYTVERAGDRTTFSDLLTREVTVPVPDAYQAADLRPLSGTSYYRLRIHLKDGQFVHSDIQEVYWGQEDQLRVQVYPVPALRDEPLQVSVMGASGEVVLSLRNIAGQVVLRRSVPVSPGVPAELPLSDLAPGMYLLQISVGWQVVEEKIQVR
ncbi:MAG: PQQ-dependent sugar dehydrogenase [Bacteroidia bacterium]|nr:PQQ-dependent sugar dehydrogenase [Bacteroidia bacterium]